MRKDRLKLMLKFTKVDFELTSN